MTIFKKVGDKLLSSQRAKMKHLASTAGTTQSEHKGRSLSKKGLQTPSTTYTTEDIEFYLSDV